MDIFLKVDINLFLALYLAVFSLYIAGQINKTSKAGKYLIVGIGFLIFELVLEAILQLIEMANLVQFAKIFPVMYSVYLMSSLFIPYFFMLFIFTYVNPEYDLTKKKIFAFSLPVVLTIIAIVTNIFTHFVFTINDGIYITRNFLFIPILTFAFAYNVFAIIFLINHRKRLSNFELTVLIVLEITPIIGAVIQFGSRIFLALWSINAVGNIILLAILQDKAISFDVLTKALTRNSFDRFLDGLSKKNDSNFSIAFIDLDDFKMVNDMYGHAEGDFALTTFASLVMSVLPKGCKLVRYGGDEFLIYFNTLNIENVKSMLCEIEQTINKYNKTSTKDYDLKYSCGYEAYDKEKYLSASQLIRNVDKTMYNIKLDKKFANSPRKKTEKIRINEVR